MDVWRARMTPNHWRESPIIDVHDQMAKRTERDFPRWLVMWGPYSMEYWAYPCFYVPRGTIVHSSDPAELTTNMRAIQIAAATDRQD